MLLTDHPFHCNSPLSPQLTPCLLTSPLAFRAQMCVLGSGYRLQNIEDGEPIGSVRVITV